MDEAPKRKRGRPPLTPEEREARKNLPKPKTGMGGLHNFPAAQLPDTEAGDNSKFLTHALRVRAMPPIDSSDPEQVRTRINEYFSLCAADDIKPSVKGFLNSLRVAKSTLWEWKTGGYRANTHQAIILEAYDVLEALWEDYMLNGKINPVSGIFLGKNNFGYQDKQEMVLTPNTKVIDSADVSTMEQKYAELPED